MSAWASRGGKLRVLHILQSLNYGGMERLLFEMMRRFDRERFENHVLVLSYVGRFGTGMEEYGMVHVADPMSRLSMLRPASLAKNIGAIAPDIVHSHSGVWYKASLAARMAGVPWLVHTDHGRAVPDPLVARALDGAAARRTNVIVAVSQSVADVLKRNVTRHWDRIHVVPNGVDVDLFRPLVDDGVLRAECNIPTNSPIIGSIGRLEPIKGYEVMVAAYAELRHTWPSDRATPVLVVAGDGSQRPALTALGASLGVADGIRWLGWRDDIAHLHAAFGLFTMSSHSEGTSVSLLEAMSAGVCPVVTNVGGNGAVVGPTLTHRLVPPAEPKLLAQAWQDVLMDDTSRIRDQEAARSRVLDAFTLDAMVREYQRLYSRDVAPQLSMRPSVTM